MGLVYCHANHLIICPNKSETGIDCIEDENKIKKKQTLIAMARNHLLTFASLPTPLIFHYTLPLKVDNNEKLGVSEKWQRLGISLGLWRSMTIRHLNSFLFRLHQHNY
jgi:hypothetical protein